MLFGIRPFFLNFWKIEFPAHYVQYRRYIDDVILGPVKRSPMIGKILQIFNSVNEDIKFTLESPDVGKPLNFLDISIKIINFGIEYSWFTKPSHSNNSLRQDSWVPQHVKTNYVKNAIANVNQRCSKETLQHKCLQKLNERFHKNVFFKYQAVEIQAERKKA